MAAIDARPQITPTQVYQVEDRASIRFGIADDLARASFAKCNAGDILLGGGCWVYRKDEGAESQAYQYKHPVVAFGPTPQPPMGQPSTNKQQYVCFYGNRADADPDMVVVATAICYDATP